MKFIYTFGLAFGTLLISAQTNPLLINPNINLPKDTLVSKALTNSLNNFLQAAQKPNSENNFVYQSQKVETFILLDEINGIEKSGKYKNNFFYKPYLNNVVFVNDSSYFVQVSYMGVNDGVALLRASFQFIAHKANNSFTFSSLLVNNTRYWKIQKLNNHNIFHYQNTINQKNVALFNKHTQLFDAKLKSVGKTNNAVINYYHCDNSNQLQKLIGVDYKADYNGSSYNTWVSTADNQKLIVLGNNNPTFDYFDPHDLWHDRLGLVISRDSVNKPIDEGCAYLYGGSWGITWPQIFKAFKEQVASNKNTDWLAIKETPLYFKTNNYPNTADYIVNALLIQKIEKEKGFAGVWEFLNVGPFQKGNEKYYQTLQKLTGITKANYNTAVWQLINNQK